jgi:hypothetical protein
MRIPVVRDQLDAALPVLRHQPGKSIRPARAKAARDYHRLVEKKQAASISAEVAQLHYPHLVAHSALDADRGSWKPTTSAVNATAMSQSPAALLPGWGIQGTGMPEKSGPFLQVHGGLG